MDKCNCYHKIYDRTECWGAKERDLCSCDGDETKCSFYPEKRAAAQAKKVTEDFNKNRKYTYEETREQFLMAWNTNAYINMCESSDVENVIKALEKQIPKKPTKLDSKLLIEAGWIYKCPTCGLACGANKYHLEATQDEFYCTQCGQRLDWE